MARSGKIRVRKFADRRAWIDALRILSADCAFPILCQLEIVTKLTHEPMRDIARRSYDRLLNGASSIYNISLRPDRLEAIFSDLLDRVSREVGKAEAEGVRNLVEMLVASEVNDDNMPSDLAYTLLLKLRMGYPDMSPPSEDRQKAQAVVELFACADDEVKSLSEQLEAESSIAGMSDWDRQISLHTPNAPTNLNDSLSSLLRHVVWTRFEQRLKKLIGPDEMKAFRHWLKVEAIGAGARSSLA